MKLSQNDPKPEQAFTLVEVILAIGISVGILVVALFFYSQAANLRNQLLEEAENISSIRLAMDRLTLELQTAFLSPQQGFRGTRDSLEFTTSSIMDPKSWNRPRNSRPEGPVTDLRLITYRLVASQDSGTNLVVAGLERTEEPLLIGSKKSQPSSRPDMNFPGALTNRLFADSSNSLAGVASTNQTQSELLNTAIRLARFRFWDGSQWVESWNQSGLPQGVEITFSPEPVQEENPSMPEEMESFGPGENDIYRRVVFLPGAKAGAISEGNRS